MESKTSAIFIHPEDRKALQNLKSISLLPQVIKLFFKVYNEQLLHGISMANKIRIGPDQLPDLYNKLLPICSRLEIDEPEFYLEMNPVPNAFAFGDTRIFVTLTSGLVESLEDDEIDAVIAHECGHIACRHMLYHTMAYFLAEQGMQALGVLKTLAKPILWALMYWSRRSEFSADRAAAYVLGSAKPVVQTMIRLAGGPKSLTGKINIERYLEQAETYNRLQESDWDKFLQTTPVLNSSHPFPAVRAREITRWCDQPAFKELIESRDHLLTPGMTCVACGKQLKSGWKFCGYCGCKVDSLPVT